MPMWFRLSVVFFTFALMGLAMFWQGAGLLGKKVKLAPCLLFCVFSSIMYTLSMFAAAFTLYDVVFTLTFDKLYDVIFTMAEVAVFGLILRKFYQIPYVHGLTAAMLSHFIVHTASNVVDEATTAYSPIFGGRYLYVFITIVLPSLWALFVAVIAAYILRKSKFYRYFTALFANRLRTGITLMVSCALMYVWMVIDWFYPNAEPNALYALFYFSLITVVLLWVQYMAMYAAGQEKIHAQEETIAQQQAHMELLEELQQEIRAFRHDVNNLLSGMTLQVQEGDLKGIQEFMRRTGSYFDEKLGNEIRQMDCLGNIGMYPIRSLLTTKLAAMRQKHIQSALEVLYPVHPQQIMETEDLLRGLGILLDNAIEAVPQDNAQVRVVLLQEEKELYIAIANNYETAPNLSALSQKGYTTKGSGRGTGLSSYRKIVSRYPNCITRTYLKDGLFVQELRMPAA